MAARVCFGVKHVPMLPRSLTLLKMTWGARVHNPEASATKMKEAANSGGPTVV
jgi:hypothetical protein